MTGCGQEALQIYRQLLVAYGQLHWWPADTSFEVMVGAILTQNTRWNNVETAIANLKRANMLDAERICNGNRKQLEVYIRPAGFFRQKSRYLQAMSLFYYQHGCTSGLKKWPISSLRKKLLAVQGIGPETADSILLYALDKPIFVIDAYTRRIFTRLGHLPLDADYRYIQYFFHSHLPRSLSLFREYHALIVEHAKRHCRIKPLCAICLLASCCAFAQSGTAESNQQG